jgi:hypothetical protein
MAIEELEGKDTNVSSRKGVFIPDITVEMFRNASLEGVEELMASGKMEDISLPSAQPERPKGKWITDDLSGIIYCSRCGNAAPMETTGGRQYKSKFCQTCGADMRGGQDVIKYMADDAQYFVDVEEALNMAISALTEQQWIPVTERLPAYGEDVLISIGGYCNVGHIVSVNEEEQYNWYFSGWYHLPNDVDAWMPLPEPYREDKE